jgi:phosphatidylglycerol:prolipoprotein diacylglycerol transferase
LGIALHPTQIYEAVTNVILFLVLGHFWKHGRTSSLRPGLIAVAYVLIYASARFFLEFYRGDERGEMFLGLSPSQWIALSALSATMGICVYQRVFRRV